MCLILHGVQNVELFGGMLQKLFGRGDNYRRGHRRSGS
jgi:hypothetical protein